MQNTLSTVQPINQITILSNMQQPNTEQVERKTISVPDIPFNVPIKWNVASEYQHLTPNEIAALYKDRADTNAIACINLRCDSNIGLMVRLSAIYGVGKCYVIGRRQYDKRSSVGTNHHVPVERFFAMTGGDMEFLDVQKVINHILEFQKKYTVVFIEQSTGSHSVYRMHEIPMNKPPVFVFGSETDGLPSDVLKLPDTYCVTIPQRGIGRSLNVATACGIVLAEWYRDELMT